MSPRSPPSSLNEDETYRKFVDLEFAILTQGHEIDSKQARIFHNSLISYYKEFINYQRQQKYGYSKEHFVLFNFMNEKALNVEKILLQFFSPTYTLSSTKSSSKMNDQHTTNSDLSSLLRKQKFYTKMIDSLVPTDELNLKEAEVQCQHLEQFYEKFISNQTEITTIVDDASFDDQVEISQNVQKKVREIQAKLKEIISPSVKTVPPALTKSLINEHFNQTERPRVIVDFLDSQMKKQKSLVEQIELIESKNDPGTVEAETLHGHLSQLHDTFVKNQSKIENYVSGPALDEQLRISGEILQKVITLQTKLKEISAPIVSQAEDGSVGESQPKLSFSFGYLEWLRERQTDLRKEVDHVISSRGYSVSAQEEVKKLYEWFNLYQKKIEQLVSEFPYDLKKAKENLDAFQGRLEKYRLNCKSCKCPLIDSFF